MATVLANMNYSPTLLLPFKHAPLATASTLGPHLWDSKDLAEAEAAHKAEGERMQQAMHAHDNAKKKAAERAEVARHVSLYKARQEEPGRKMQELEGAKAAVAEAFARQRDAIVV